ncbi:MAG: dicarboxylate/amino acid:cation symporter [Candidatus Marinimicrobia bacterium]|nr:dicarboxylate/amino acid:cation symporter [Candidatus Neomarinimicrobiota bacterium]MBT3575067.1 dicarboxylate/amino acid:cation symporter [Candidatus Neomarinimicrobiota bacterium]MBT3678839.1 dicarboxylate/amino acid:cation symporter [Candidatus Neomarinimicrobiota bacterium]MBT3949953.1 dicarboxylate/amino acid:cation symporter [Candidatus Neomarinimicrobiota bacterium]MBT4252656.1 dicarboxylate/amino acid:cation symporter [Candidatus Neomarinimicrobiota bacterium]
MELYWKVFIGMGAGIIYALLMGEQAMNVAPLGDMFMRLLKMVIVPLIFFSITSGVSGIGENKSLGRLGAKTFGYYFLTSMLAILIGLTLTNVIQPGVGVDINAGGKDFDPSSLSQPGSLGNILIRMIPTNPIAAAAKGDVLSVIFFSIVLGMAITVLPEKQYKFMHELFDTFFKVMMKMTQGVIMFLPIGVFGLIAKAVASTGFTLFKAVGWYMVTIASGLTIHIFIVLPIVFYLFTKINPMKHYKAIASAMATAFSTSSSGATLPVTMDCIENRAGVSNKVTSFVLPLGATINMDGTALYECAGVLFISQALGFDLTVAQQLLIVITAFLASVGAAAIPSAGLVMIFIVLDAVGLGDHPQAAIIVGTMLAVDRPLDMFRTVVNVTSDTMGAVIVAKSEGEEVLTKV